MDTACLRSHILEEHTDGPEDVDTWLRNSPRPATAHATCATLIALVPALAALTPPNWACACLRALVPPLRKFDLAALGELWELADYLEADAVLPWLRVEAAQRLLSMMRDGKDSYAAAQACLPYGMVYAARSLLEKEATALYERVRHLVRHTSRRDVPWVRLRVDHLRHPHTWWSSDIMLSHVSPCLSMVLRQTKYTPPLVSTPGGAAAHAANQVCGSILQGAAVLDDAPLVREVLAALPASSLEGATVCALESALLSGASCSVTEACVATLKQQLSCPDTSVWRAVSEMHCVCPHCYGAVLDVLSARELLAADSPTHVPHTEACVRALLDAAQLQGVDLGASHVWRFALRSPTTLALVEAAAGCRYPGDATRACRAMMLTLFADSPPTWEAHAKAYVARWIPADAPWTAVRANAQHLWHAALATSHSDHTPRLLDTVEHLLSAHRDRWAADARLWASIVGRPSPRLVVTAQGLLWLRQRSTELLEPPVSTAIFSAGTCTELADHYARKAQLPTFSKHVLPLFCHGAAPPSTPLEAAAWHSILARLVHACQLRGAKLLLERRGRVGAHRDMHAAPSQLGFAAALQSMPRGKRRRMARLLHAYGCL